MEIKKIKKGTLVLLPKKSKYIPQTYRLALVISRVRAIDGQFKVKCIDGQEKFVTEALPLIHACRATDVEDAIEKYNTLLLDALIEIAGKNLGYT